MTLGAPSVDTGTAMATTPTKATIEPDARFTGMSVSSGSVEDTPSGSGLDLTGSRPSGRDALQALLAFSALHEQVRRRRALARRQAGFDTISATAEFEAGEQFVLDEVLQLVAERAVAITGADGLAIALAENDEIVLRASAGVIKPGVGARLDRDSAFSGACFRTAQIVRCDDTEIDPRVNLHACRHLGARSMVAVPLCGRRRVIGLLEAFSAEIFGFNESDVRSLELLAELILGALKPEDEDRFAESAQVAATRLETPGQTASTTKTTEKPRDSSVAIGAISVDVSLGAGGIGVSSGSLAGTNTPRLPPSDSASPDAGSPAAPSSSFTPTADSAPALVNSALARVEMPGKDDKAEQASPAAVEARVARHHPGVVLGLVLVVIASMLAGGLWWKLKNDQIKALVVPAPDKVTSRTTRSSSSDILESGPGISTPAVTGGIPSDGISSDAASGENTKTTTADTSTANQRGASKLPRVTGIRHWSSADSTTVVLDLQDQVQYEAHRLTGPDRIYFDLHDTGLAPELGKTIDVGDGLLSRIRMAQPEPNTTRIVLETKGGSNFSVSLEPNPYRLVVQVRKIGADNRARVDLFRDSRETDADKLAIVVAPPTREDLQLRARVPKMRIALDAGHGGWDLGTVGRRGLLEKDLVLEIAERLGKLLQSRLGSEVIFTRQDDNYVPLDERAAMANQAQADLFVSIHANYSDLASARGVETYYTNFFTAPGAREVEVRENGGASNNLPTVKLSGVELKEKIEQSRRLAASVQRSLYATLAGQNPGIRDRGVKEAGFVVLTATSMPAILAEVSFVSSPTDEKKLRNDGYREQIAEALYRGIARYAASSHGVKVASVGK
jgi:N-acetylmuramoyl-L-alanine amidase/putative methionine-R-sulfoxide reductase with GAF domain